MTDLVTYQNPSFTGQTQAEQLKAKIEIQKQKSQQTSILATQLKSDLSDHLRRALELVQEKGASSW